MEHADEALRLEKQATQSNYSLNNELQFLNLSNHNTILDAGCGTGLLSRYIQGINPKSDIYACDQSELRLAQAKKLTVSNTINFSVQNLESTDYATNTFDLVISRYVYEHLSKHEAVTSEIYRILKPGGIAYLVDFDGIFLNYHSSNKNLNNYLKELKEKLDIDLFIGRKLPQLLGNTGFNNIQWEVQLNTFKSEQEISEEYENCKERCRFARTSFIEIFNSEERADEFISLYLENLKKPESCFFYNKLIAWGIK